MQCTKFGAQYEFTGVFSLLVLVTWTSVLWVSPAGFPKPGVNLSCKDVVWLTVCWSAPSEVFVEDAIILRSS